MVPLCTYVNVGSVDAQIWPKYDIVLPIGVGEIWFSGIGGQVSLCGLAPLLNMLES